MPAEKLCGAVLPVNDAPTLYSIHIVPLCAPGVTLPFNVALVSVTPVAASVTGTGGALNL